MSNWYEKINLKTAHILEQIKAHRFIQELMAGTLPKDIFYFYINQDAIYLSEYKKILAQIGIKCYDENDTQFFLNAATGIINVENALHQNFLNQKIITNEASITCELYISYLSRMAHTKSLEEGLAALTLFLWITYPINVSASLLFGVINNAFGNNFFKQSIA